MKIENVGVIIPALNASKSIVKVLEEVPKQVRTIVVVVDGCKQGTDRAVFDSPFSTDSRVVVIVNPQNLGVGGATIKGIEYLMNDEQIDCIIKIDADGQIDPKLIPNIVEELHLMDYDLIKGNRLKSKGNSEQMPTRRLIANNLATFFFKISTGLWRVEDPANGFFAVRKKVFEFIDLEKLKKRWFFETDLLGAIAIRGGVVGNFPMKAHYGEEKSNVNISTQIVPFLYGFFQIYRRRILQKYFKDEINFGTMTLLFSISNFLFLIYFIWRSLWPEFTKNEVITSGQAAIFLFFVLNFVYGSLAFVFLDTKIHKPKTPPWRI